MKFIAGLLVIVGVTLLAYCCVMRPLDIKEAMSQVEEAFPRALMYHRCQEGVPLSQPLDSLISIKSELFREKSYVQFDIDLGICRQQHLFWEPDLLSDFFAKTASLVEKDDIDRVGVLIKTQEGQVLEFYEPLNE